MGLRVRGPRRDPRLGPSREGSSLCQVSVPEATAVRLGTPAGRAVIAAATLGSGLATLDGTVVNVALRAIGEDLDASLAELQWITN
jgi:hypothetical protein